MGPAFHSDFSTIRGAGLRFVLRALTAFMLCLFGCDERLGSGTDPAISSDGGSGDATEDAVMTPDSSAVAPRQDGGDAVGPDSGSVAPCDCEASSSCVTVPCHSVGGICPETPVEDGTACGESSATICITGACTMRRCGDGYLEPGPTPARELCDDGNAINIDACSNTCEPNFIVVDMPDPEGDGHNAYHARPLAGPYATGIDGAGAVLFLGTRDRFTHADLVARRATAAGVFQQTNAEDFIELETGLPSFDSVGATVVGLPGGGWVVVWSAPRAATQDIVARVVRADGTLGSERVVNVQRVSTQEGPAAAVVDGEIVIAWTDRYVSAADPFGGVRARRFTQSLVPIGGEILIASERGNAEQDVSIAPGPDGQWIAGWVRRGGTLATPRLALRRFSDGTPVDTADVAYYPTEPADQLLLSFIPSFGLCGTMLRSFAQDPLGDIKFASFPFSDPSMRNPAPIPGYATAAREANAAGAVSIFAFEAVHIYELGTPSRLRIANATPGGPSLSSVLDTEVSARGYDHGAMMPGPRGFWVTWSGTLPGLGADRAHLAFLLPYGTAP